jgi:hypothetical protein
MRNLLLIWNLKNTFINCNYSWRRLKYIFIANFTELFYVTQHLFYFNNASSYKAVIGIIVATNARRSLMRGNKV